MTADLVRVTDLGRLPYEPAYELQVREVDRVLADRAAAEAISEPGTSSAPLPPVGTLFLVEHDPVITITPRQSAMANLLATPELLARAGVQLAKTDRGGDITYHGPGQLVVYPILDLNRLNLGLHAYMRLLEQAVIDTCAQFGVEGHRDPTATGVWVTSSSGVGPSSPVAEPTSPVTDGGGAESSRRRGRGILPLEAPAKIAAMGVRVRKWISMHGLALNVATNLDHFNLIVPCGLSGRPVTSLQQLLGPDSPTMPAVKSILTDRLAALIRAAHETALAARADVRS